jgi:hypothetical protein
MDSTTDTRPDVPSDDLSTEFLRARLQQTVFNALENAENALIRAPTSLGKSYLVATTPWLSVPEMSGGKSVVQISPTLEARNDAAAKSKQAGVRSHILRGREEVCPVAAGEYDDMLQSPDGTVPSEWFDEMCDSRGIDFTTVHREFHRFDPLPCMAGGKCAGLGRYEILTLEPTENDEDSPEPDFDVIHTTATHAYVPWLVKDRNIVFDERPDFTLDFEQDPLRDAATHHLQSTDQSLTWEKMMTAVQEQHETAIDRYQNVLADSPRPKPFDGGPYFRDLPEILKAILRARPVGNDRFRGRYGRLTVVFDTGNTIQRIVVPPDLSEARCVIGLDGHPCPDLWNANLDLDLKEERLLTTDEARSWRKSERGLTVVRLGPANYARPLTKGWRGKTREAQKKQERKARLIIEQLHAEYPGEFRTCITSKKLAPEADTMMRAAGIQNPKVMYFGEEKSRNDFADETVGLILGSIDPGDDMILDWLAVLGLYAEPERYENGQRAYGRGFKGKDADAAARFLASVREDHIAQSIGRYARSPGSGTAGATVYVWSSAIPEELLDGVAPGHIRENIGEYQLEIESLLYATTEPLTHSSTARTVGCSRKHAYKTLNRLVDLGVASKSKGTGRNGADEYTAVGDSQPPAVDLRWESV